MRLLPLAFVLSFACAPGLEDSLEKIRSLQEQGRYVEALEPVSNLFERFPDEPEVLRLYGTQMLALDNAALAVWPLRRLSERPQPEIEDLLLYSRALESAGATRAALASTGRILEIEPDHLGALVLRARLADDRGEPEIVLEAAERLTREARRPMVFIWKSRAYSRLDRFEEAYDTLEEGLRYLGDRPQALPFRVAFCKAETEVAKATGDDAELEERWTRCVEQNPADPQLVVGAVAFFDGQGEEARATEILERAIAAAPRNLDHRVQLAQRWSATGRVEEAEALLLEATRIEEIQRGAWLAVSDHYREREDFAASVSAIERALVDQDAVDTLLLAQYADDCIQADQLEQAERAIELLNRPEYAAMLRGRIHLVRREPTKALEQLREGLRLFPGNAVARYLSGQAAERLGDVDLAIAEYRDAVRAGPTDSDAAFALIRFYEAERNFVALNHVLFLRLKRNPADGRAQAALARIRTLYADEPELARAAIEDLSAIPGEEVAAAVAEGRLAQRLAGPDAAVEAIASRDLDLSHPERFEALQALLDHLLQAGRSQEALGRVEESLAVRPDFAGFHEAHARVLEAAGRPGEEVEAALQRALDRDPDSVAALMGMARVAQASGRTDDALAWYDRAIDADESDAKPVWGAIRVAIEANRDDEVERLLDEALYRDAIHQGALVLAASRRLAAESDLERASELAARAVRFGGSAEAFTLYGRISLELEAPVRAVRALAQATRIRPRSPTTRYHLARALAASGESDAAIDELNRALSGADFPEAEKARAQLARLEAQQARSDDGA